MTPLGKLLAFSYIAFCVFTFCQPFGNLCRKMKYFHVKCAAVYSTAKIQIISGFAISRATGHLRFAHYNLYK